MATLAGAMAASGWLSGWLSGGERLVERRAAASASTWAALHAAPLRPCWAAKAGRACRLLAGPGEERGSAEAAAGAGGARAGRWRAL